MNGNPELIVVMPVYNEERVIDRVIKDWAAALKNYRMPFQIHVYDDASQDSTPTILDGIARQDPCVTIHFKEHSGHGPTLVQAYR